MSSRSGRTSGRTSTESDKDKDKESIMEHLDRKLASLATKECINQLKNIIEEQNRHIKKHEERINKQEEKITVLESTISVLQTGISRLSKSNEETEQYGRRLCLRIDGIDSTPDETAEVCLEKCKKIFRTLEVDVPDTVLDRAHRIGKPKYKDGIKQQTMMVRFTTWRHRTAVYRARKKDKSVRIRLDLTKQRLDLLIKAQKVVEERDDIMYAFADVNCRLSVKHKSGKFTYFNDIEDLLNNM